MNIPLQSHDPMLVQYPMIHSLPWVNILGKD